MERLTIPVHFQVCPCLEGDRNQACSLAGWDLNSQRSAPGMKPGRFFATLFLAFACGLVLVPQAKAAFIGNYSLANSTLTNTNADGSVTTPDNGQTIVLTGGNNGSGLLGMTDLLFTAAGSGPVQFHYSYSSLDFPGSDFAGYLVGNNFTNLATFDGATGSANFTVSLGQPFGFRVVTEDNTGEPGVFTVSDFSAPTGGGAAVPEPGTAPVLILAAALAIGAEWRMRRRFCAKV